MTAEEAIKRIKEFGLHHAINDLPYSIKTVEAFNMAIEALEEQKTGKWIDKSRGEQKNSECSECHTLFRVLIHDYPYCPCCGSRNRGEEDD